MLIDKLADVSPPEKRILLLLREFVFDTTRSSCVGTPRLLNVGELNPGLMPAIPVSLRIEFGTA